MAQRNTVSLADSTGKERKEFTVSSNLFLKVTVTRVNPIGYRPIES